MGALKKIIKHVYMIPGERFDSHVYVLDDGDGFVLIDTGVSNKIEVIDPRDVKLVILTHCHLDHSGQAWRFSNVACSKKCFLHLANWEENVMLRDYAKGKGLNIKRFMPAKVLYDNDIIELNRFVLRIVYTPGHTDGSIAIYEEENKLMFTGDTLFAYGIVGTSNVPTGDEGLLKNSVLRIISYPWNILLPGHGPLERRELIYIKK